MELALHLEGKNAVYLRVPTLWDAVKNEWMACIQTPKTLKIIHAHGKDSFELENSFNIAFSKAFETDGEEIFNMFKAKEYWDRDQTLR